MSCPSPACVTAAASTSLAHLRHTPPGRDSIRDSHIFQRPPSACQAGFVYFSDTGNGAELNVSAQLWALSEIARMAKVPSVPHANVESTTFARRKGASLDCPWLIVVRPLSGGVQRFDTQGREHRP